MCLRTQAQVDSEHKQVIKGECLCPTKIFIGNVPYDVKERELLELFAPCGRIVSLEITRDPETGKSKGWARCEFAKKANATHKSSATIAVATVNGRELKGRTLRVKFVYLPTKDEEEEKEKEAKGSSKKRKKTAAISVSSNSSSNDSGSQEEEDEEEANTPPRPRRKKERKMEVVERKPLVHFVSADNDGDPHCLTFDPNSTVDGDAIVTMLRTALLEEKCDADGFPHLTFHKLLNSCYRASRGLPSSMTGKYSWGDWTLAHFSVRGRANVRLPAGEVFLYKMLN